jgi:hypothetical protein
VGRRGGEPSVDLHRPKQLHRALRCDGGRRGLALDDRSEESSLHICGLIDTWRDAIDEELGEHIGLVRWRRREQLHQGRRPLRIERKWHDALRCALVDVLLVLGEKGGGGAAGAEEVASGGGGH